MNIFAVSDQVHVNALKRCSSARLLWLEHAAAVLDVLMRTGRMAEIPVCGLNHGCLSDTRGQHSLKSRLSNEIIPSKYHVAGINE